MLPAGKKRKRQEKKGKDKQEKVELQLQQPAAMSIIADDNFMQTDDDEWEDTLDDDAFSTNECANDGEGEIEEANDRDLENVHDD